MVDELVGGEEDILRMVGGKSSGDLFFIFVFIFVFVFVLAFVLLMLCTC